jgi:hypothetical protein
LGRLAVRWRSLKLSALNSRQLAHGPGTDMQSSHSLVGLLQTGDMSKPQVCSLVTPLHFSGDTITITNKPFHHSQPHTQAPSSVMYLSACTVAASKVAGLQELPSQGIPGVLIVVI